MSTELIPNYDEMNVGDVGEFLRDHTLTPEQLAAVRDYEAAHKDRKTVYRDLDEAAERAPDPEYVVLRPHARYVAGEYFDSTGGRETVRYTPRVAEALSRPDRDRPFDLLDVVYGDDAYDPDEADTETDTDASGLDSVETQPVDSTDDEVDADDEADAEDADDAEDTEDSDGDEGISPAPLASSAELTAAITRTQSVEPVDADDTVDGDS